MASLNQAVARCTLRWRVDLRELTSGLMSDPFVQRRGRSWDRDFVGEVGPADVHYAVFLTILSLLPAAVIAYTSTAGQIAALSGLFRAPVQVVITGFLASVLIFAGSHFNRSARPFSTAFKLMLRVMSVHPILAFLFWFPFGEPISLLIFGFCVVRGMRKTYDMPLRNVLLFFGTVYVMFALLQCQSILAPPVRPGDSIPQFRDGG